MSFAGHVFDMIKRSEANREMVRRQREHARQLQALHIGTGNRSETPAETVTPEQRAEAIRAIRSEARRRRRRERIAGWTLGAILAAAAAYVIYLFV